ncbi:glycosyltransferase family 2 protein [Limosilactobacillus vaginalis]|uniref:Glycosyltransferase, group 2 family protein n=1 Tax=Limosilactobacillus vaginalis DSM 5837 = ATCC 49540 TaxID=1423814 RepID=C2ESW8_9LACO|nr:glycosyltransferase family 2 protein [Limosilactobacillus vaginalis]EEJ41000.1 glycosyltransferase, group 2 family protein [Limosilactobacillus vaginalis DSM 5837 = ATCC 49540]KRM41367.1 glycosyltransferase CpsIVJ [Limosilactobacillus vaginalis DSM 5837 = ATCC 49540]QFS34257.1 glycosyltransferase [Limosilactobacillus vaginalis]
MNKEKVSVIVPAYNAEKYICSCIDSIVNQTYKNLQIILIDDGSTDKTLDIFNSYSLRDSRITVFTKENQGIATTRNFGLMKSNGNYIVFVDSDDYIKENMVELLLKSIKENRTDMVMCNSQLVGIDGKPKVRDTRNFKKRFFNSGVWTEKDFWDHLYNGFWGECTVPWGKLYKSTLFKNVRYSDGKTNEDDYILYDLIHGCSISVISEKLYFHRDRENSITNSNGGVGEKYLDGVDAVLLRVDKALLNNQKYLVQYSLNAIPTLMVLQYQCRKSIRYKRIKEDYKTLVKRAKHQRYLSLKSQLMYFCFYYFQIVYYLMYIAYRKL